jgi:hypothetical protein
MTRHLKPMFVYPALAAMLFGFIYFFTAGYGNGLGLDADVGAGLLLVLPGLLIVVIGVLFTVGMSGQFSVIGYGALGVGLAILLQEMYDGGIIVDAMLGGASIAQYEMIIVILGVVLGGVAYASKR